MTRHPRKNIAASVRQRLQDKARATDRPVSELFQYFAIERFLYRLSSSPYVDTFVLKGALMLTAWKAPWGRPTMDIDLLGQIDNTLETITSLTKEVCQRAVEPDGIVFDTTRVKGERIVEGANYEGVRVRFQGNLANARIPLQLDIGFGDVVVPSAVSMEYPTILDLPAPQLRGYTKESFIAEKFEAMVKLGMLNSRLKDFFDIWLLSRQFNFDGKILSTAITQTFLNRGTKLMAQPVALTSAFTNEPSKTAQWRGFLRKNRLQDVPQELNVLIATIRTFLSPVADTLAAGESFAGTWHAPGPWQK